MSIIMKTLVNRPIHLVIAWDLASIFFLLPWIRKLRNRWDSSVVQTELSTGKFRGEICLPPCAYFFNPAPLKAYSYYVVIKLFFFYSIALSSFAVPRGFPLLACKITFSCVRYYRCLIVISKVCGIKLCKPFETHSEVHEQLG